MITLNGVSLQTANIISSTIQHDNSTPQALNSLKLARRDGEKLICANFATKEIILTGSIIHTDQATLEDFLDTFKGEFNVINGSLVVGYGSGYRLYYVNTEYISFPRDSSNITWVPFEIKFMVMDPPLGLDCDVNGVPILTNAYAKTTNAYSEVAAPSFLGSAAPKPQIKLTFDNIGDVSSLDLVNQTTGKQLNLAPTLANGDVVLVDTDVLKVSQNGVEIPFTGSIPNFLLGVNNFMFDFYSSTGVTLESSQTTNNSKKPFWSTRKPAQSFTISVAAAIPKLSLILSKVGAPTGDVTLTIQTDTAGSPSGTPVTNGTMTITAAEIGANPTWINKTFTTAPILAASTLYWIVLTTTGGDVSNFVQWHYNNAGGYANGSAKYYVAAWAAIASSDFCFKIFKTVVDQSNANLSDETVTEPFSATTNKDADNTTADWNTSLGRLKLNSSNVIDQQQTTVSAALEAITGPEANANSNPRASQSFIPSYSGHLTQVGVYVDNQSALTLSIYAANSSGLPTGSALGTATLSVTATAAWKVVDFSNIALTAGNRYCIVMTEHYSNPDPDMGSWYGANSNAYANGNAGDYDQYAGWTARTGVDFAFKIYMLNYASPEAGQSNALDAGLSVIASATLNDTEVTPADTSIDHKLSSDGSAFESVTLGVEHYFSVVGSALKFLETLTSSNVDSTPYIDSMTVTYKTAGIINNTNNLVAQSFVPGYTGNLSGLAINVMKVGTPGNLTAKIYADSGGLPNGAALATQAIASSAVNSGAFLTNMITFASPASLNSGTTYWIVISGASVDATNYYLIRTRPGNLYTPGQLKCSTDNGANYTAFTNEDIIFSTYKGAGNLPTIELSIDYCKRFA